MSKSNRKKPFSEPQKIFYHAERFFGAIDQLHKTSIPKRYEFIQAPIIMLSAFASELYLKCLICGDLGAAPRGHSLLPLFNKLGAASQEAIEKRWDEAVSLRESDLRELEQVRGKPIPRSLVNALKLSGQSYEEVRYLYEQAPRYYSAIGDLPLVLRLAIKDLEPTWIPNSYFTPPS